MTGGLERHLLAASHWSALGGHPGAVWSAHDLREPLQPLAQGGRLDRLLEAALKAYDGDIQMIDSSSIRVHLHAANTNKKTNDPVAWVARAGGDAECRPRFEPGEERSRRIEAGKIAVSAEVVPHVEWPRAAQVARIERHAALAAK